MKRVLYSVAAVMMLVLVTAGPAVANSSKVQVCHLPPSDPTNFHTITISEKALPAHLGHGDLPGSCFANAEALCDDGNACTIDVMDMATETCLADHPPVDCDDGLLCTADSCDPTNGCQNAPIVCDDGDLCTVDTCNPYDGQCTATPKDCGSLGICVADTGGCNYPCDGIACDPIDQCHEAGKCVLPGECEPGDPVPDGTPCNDGNDGTSDDQCTGGVCAGEAICPCWTPQILAGLRYPEEGDQLACNKDYSKVNDETNPTHGVENHDIWMIKLTDAEGVVYWVELQTTEISYHTPTVYPYCGFRDLCRDGNCTGAKGGTNGPLTPEEFSACEADVAAAGLARGFSCLQ